ncbi:MAG: hypothetical protein NZ519_09560 [Bacteroidia bacterium]|nr:hypothetical protein [Bacteroidia bacterium]
MKYVFKVTLLCVVFCSLSIAQKSEKSPKLYLETYTEKNKDKKIILQYQYIKDEYKKPLYHGIYKRWDSTGSYLLVSGKYVYGQKDSLWVEYYAENRPKYETFYQNNLKHGYSKEYDENGILKEEGNYKYGKKDGIFKFYYPDGKIHEVITFSEDKMHGQFQRFYPNGNVAVTGNYYYDQKTGLWEYFYENGNLESQENYLGGLLHGEYLAYHPNKQLKTEGFYYAGQKDGRWLSFQPNGLRDMVAAYKQGKVMYESKVEICQVKTENLIAQFECIVNPKTNEHIPVGKYSAFWDENFKKVKSSGYFNLQGSETGIWRYYHKNGMLSAIGKYVDGKEDSIWVEFDENGLTKSRGRYEKGEKVGFWLENFVEQGEYINGKRQGIWQEGNASGRYVDDEKEGLWIYKDSIGKIIAKGEFKKGQKTGLWQEGNLIGLYEEGTKQGMWKVIKDSCFEYYGTYMDGKKNGIWKEEGPNWQGLETIQIGMYEEGFKEGKWKVYEKNSGILIWEGYFEANDLNGTCTAYSLKKYPIYKATYEKNKVTKVILYSDKVKGQIVQTLKDFPSPPKNKLPQDYYWGKEYKW